MLTPLYDWRKPSIKEFQLSTSYQNIHQYWKKCAYWCENRKNRFLRIQVVFNEMKMISIFSFYKISIYTNQSHNICLLKIKKKLLSQRYMCIHNWIYHCLWDNINVRKVLYHRVLLKLLSLIQTAFNFCRIVLYLTIQSNRVIKSLPLSLNCFRVHMLKMKNPNHKKAPWKWSSFTTTKWKTSGG